MSQTVRGIAVTARLCTAKSRQTCNRHQLSGLAPRTGNVPKLLRRPMEAITRSVLFESGCITYHLGQLLAESQVDLRTVRDL